LHIKNLFGLTFLAFVSLPVLAGETTPAVAIASLTDPAKLATQGRWTENPAFILLAVSQPIPLLSYEK